MTVTVTNYSKQRILSTFLRNVKVTLTISRNDNPRREHKNLTKMLKTRS